MAEVLDVGWHLVTPQCVLHFRCCQGEIGRGFFENLLTDRPCRSIELGTDTGVAFSF